MLKLDNHEGNVLNLDLLCERDLRPRMRLLKTHLATQGINLALQTPAADQDLPAALSNPVLVAIADKAPAWLSAIEAPMVVLHLADADPLEQLPKRYRDRSVSVHMPTWPARSSDRRAATDIATVL